MNRLLAFFKWTLVAVGTVALGLGALVFISIWQQERAKSAALEFCAQAVIGADLAALVARAESMGAKRHYPWCDARRHVFFFQGSTFNGFDCVLSVVGGKVAASQILERLDEDGPDKVCQ